MLHKPDNDHLGWWATWVELIHGQVEAQPLKSSGKDMTLTQKRVRT